MGQESSDRNENFLIKLDDLYTLFHQHWQKSKDEPSRACAIFMKECETYKLGKTGIENEDFWILEWTTNAWVGAHKLHGKSNYVTESLHRMDTMYGPKMTRVHRENLRINRFFVMTKEGHAQSHDAFNEVLMHWNKGCPS